MLASCSGGAPQAEATQATPAAAMETVAGVSLSDAKVQLPVVSGRPGVAYFTLSLASGAPRKIVSVAVELVGRSELHQSMKMDGMTSMKPLTDVPIESGETVKFEPGGNHVMLFDLDPSLRFKSDVKLTVGFDNGDKVSAKAQVVTAGDGLENVG